MICTCSRSELRGAAHTVFPSDFNFLLPALLVRVCIRASPPRCLCLMTGERPWKWWVVRMVWPSGANTEMLHLSPQPVPPFRVLF